MDGRGAVEFSYQPALALGLWAWENRRLIEGRVLLAGGEPDALTLRSFLTGAYALLVEEYQRLGLTVLDAVEKANASIGMASGPVQPVAGADQPERVPTPAENDAALRELEKAMMGVK